MDPQGLVPKNSANNTEGRHIHNYSTFDDSLSYGKKMLVRFGDYTPSFEMEGVESDEIELNSSDAIDSLSLNAPFKGSIRKIKESFSVPNMALLPRNWDLLYVQPSNGEDVVAADVNCVIDHFPKRVSDQFNFLLRKVKTQLSTIASLEEITAADVTDWLSGLIRLMIFGEYVYSKGSLLNFCGYKANAQFLWLIKDSRSTSFDNWFDAVISAVFSKVNSMWVTIPKDDETEVGRRFLGLSGNFVKPASFPDGSFRRFLEVCRENPLTFIYDYAFSVDFEDEEGEEGLTALAQYVQYLKEVLLGEIDGLLMNGPLYRLPYYSPEEDLENDVTALAPSNCNLSRLLAYQLVCAHFYSNSSLDVNYTAQLFRSFIESVEHSLDEDLSLEWYYMLNGVERLYDAFSNAILGNCLLPASDFLLNETIFGDIREGNGTYVIRPMLLLWSYLFGFRKSLRYGDYFVGSRPRPLAPVNTDVSVNDSMVSVVDITRKIQAQRFANSVMRTKQKIEEYVKSLFGRAPAPDYHNPFFLTRQEEYIFGDAVQNTADTQSSDANSRTANFASNNGRYTFTFHNDDMHPCIYLQIISFDIKRAYTRSVERFFLHADRFDMFNPDFQYIGDQAVYGIELGYPEGSGYLPQIFSYQTRDMEYKQRFDVVCGDFEDMLPGWILTDNDQSREYNSHLNSDFIRSYNTELDQFYLSLTGFSLGRYFHFVCLTQNNVRAKRPMAVDPQILA